MCAGCLGAGLFIYHVCNSASKGEESEDSNMVDARRHTSFILVRAREDPSSSGEGDLYYLALKCS